MTDPTVLADPTSLSVGWQHFWLAIFLATINGGVAIAVAFITTRVHRRNGHHD